MYGHGRSFYEVREDVVQTGFVNAPDQLTLVLEEACALVDVLLVYAQDNTRLELIYDLQVKGFYELLYHLRPLASASKYVGIIQDQLVAFAVSFLQGL